MADKTKRRNEHVDFHPCDEPKGMNFYTLDILTNSQQKRLNNHKIEVIRGHQKYLYTHPEIRAVVQIIIRLFLRERPTCNLERFLARYFKDNWQSIVEEVKSYVESMPGKPLTTEVGKLSLKEDKRVKLEERLSEESVSFKEPSAPLQLVENIVGEILDEIIEKIDEWVLKYAEIVLEEKIPKKDEEKQRTRSDEEDDDFIFDLGLDFDLDFSNYLEDDDAKDFNNEKEDNIILESLSTHVLSAGRSDYNKKKK